MRNNSILWEIYISFADEVDFMTWIDDPSNVISEKGKRKLGAKPMPAVV